MMTMALKRPMMTSGVVDHTMIACDRLPSLVCTSLIWQVSLLETGGARAQLHAANALASLGFQNIDNQRQMSMLLVSLLGTGGVEGACNERGHQRSSVVIRDHQGSSAVIRCHQRSSAVISGHHLYGRV